MLQSMDQVGMIRDSSPSFHWFLTLCPYYYYYHYYYYSYYYYYYYYYCNTTAITGYEYIFNRLCRGPAKLYIR